MNDGCIVEESPVNQDLHGAQPEDALKGQRVTLRQGVTLQVCHAPGHAPALVFLHGGLGNRYNWRSQYEFAKSQGWETLAYDLAAHGQSSAYPRYSIGRHCRDLTRLLQRFQIQSPVLCCHSYGVPIGLEWAQRNAVRALIFISGGTHNLAPWWEIPLVKMMSWGGRHLYRFSLVQQLSQQLFSTHNHPTLQQFWAECPMPADQHAYKALEIFWAYNFFKKLKRHQYTEVPTLVMSGGKDSMFTRAMGEKLASQFRTSYHLHLPEAGHPLMAEYPYFVNQAIASWVQQWTKV
jgi:pimeloyl-ACP methyl ester carboxylesterase